MLLIHYLARRVRGWWADIRCPYCRMPLDKCRHEWPIHD